MARATVDQVRAIITTELEDSAIEAYLESASNMVGEWFSGVSATETLLTEIERWVTAHLIAMSKERQAKEEGAGGAYIKYVGLYGTGLKTTTYGQTAIEIDVTNTLEKITGSSLFFKAL